MLDLGKRKSGIPREALDMFPYNQFFKKKRMLQEQWRQVHSLLVKNTLRVNFRLIGNN